MLITEVTAHFTNAIIITLHHYAMYKMQLSVSVTAVVSFVCLLTMSCAKVAELIKMPFGCGICVFQGTMY